MRDIVVIGGYGAVGRVAADALATWFPGRVVVAGRDGAKATAFARATPGVVDGRAVDAARPQEVRALIADAAVVVMCVEQGNHRVAEMCLERGVHYVDVSASADLLAGIEGLDAVARRTGASAVLSVGLAPGLTNLLARSTVDRLPGASGVDITILLGLGGDHGPDSLRWTLDALAAPVPSRRVRPGPATADLPHFGRRRAHPFAFSDQHTLRRTLGVPVTTRLAFDSAPLTAVVFGLRAARVFRLLRGPRAAALLRAAFGRARVGGDRFALRAEARDEAGRRAWVAATGHREAEATGVVAAHVTRDVLDGVPPGVVHIDALPAWRDLLDRLAREVTITEGGSPPTVIARRPAPGRPGTADGADASPATPPLTSGG